MDKDCQPLGIQGACGTLFKITLMSHSYTIATKGTVKAFIKDLQHEVKVYQQLKPLQGHCVPFCLGGIDPVIPYSYNVGVQIVHMILLSWVGNCVETLIIS